MVGDNLAWLYQFLGTRPHPSGLRRQVVRGRQEKDFYYGIEDHAAVLRFKTPWGETCWLLIAVVVSRTVVNIANWVFEMSRDAHRRTDSKIRRTTCLVHDAQRPGILRCGRRHALRTCARHGSRQGVLGRRTCGRKRYQCHYGRVETHGGA